VLDLVRIIRKKKVSILDDEDEEHISYCPRCEKLGYLSVLKNRIYMPHELVGGKVPYDHDKWKQCHECGTIVPIYEVKKESRLVDFVETSDNPFDDENTIIGLGNRRSLTAIQKEREKLLERIDQEKDEDIKRELRKG
jgi:hypothetical protein